MSRSSSIACSRNSCSSRVQYRHACRFALASEAEGVAQGNGVLHPIVEVRRQVREIDHHDSTTWNEGMALQVTRPLRPVGRWGARLSGEVVSVNDIDSARAGRPGHSIAAVIHSGDYISVIV